MARKRMLAPEMFTSESLASLPVSTRWTWAGLLTYFDDLGRGRENAALVKAAVWPLDDTYTLKKVAADLDRLQAIGSVCRYECCGMKQIHSPAWGTWQKPSHPTPSRLCPCPTHDEGHANGSRPAPKVLARDSGAALPNVVKGSSTQFKGRGEEPAPDPAAPADVITAARILGEFVEHCGPQPRAVKQKLGEQIGLLLADGITERQVKAALKAWARRSDAAPGLLPHLVPKKQPDDLDPSKAWIREIG